MEEHEKEEPKRRKKSGKETEKMISGHEENDKREERKSAFHPFFSLSFLFLSLTPSVFLPRGFHLLKYIPFVHTFLFAFNHLTSELLRSIPFSQTIALSFSLSSHTFSLFSY